MAMNKVRAHKGAKGYTTRGFRTVQIHNFKPRVVYLERMLRHLETVKKRGLIIRTISVKLHDSKYPTQTQHFKLKEKFLRSSSGF